MTIAITLSVLTVLLATTTGNKWQFMAIDAIISAMKGITRVEQENLWQSPVLLRGPAISAMQDATIVLEQLSSAMSAWMATIYWMTKQSVRHSMIPRHAMFAILLVQEEVK